jgi:hypothetical protein
MVIASDLITHYKEGGNVMYVLNHKKMAREKAERLKEGFSAYAESAELALLIKKELLAQGLTFHEDSTEFGYWFIPVK